MEHYRYLKISKLVIEQREVNRKKVAKYIGEILSGKLLKPVSVTYCVHKNLFYLDDGCHRTVANRFIKKDIILGKVEPCWLYGCTGHDSDLEKGNIKSIVLVGKKNFIT